MVTFNKKPYVIIIVLLLLISLGLGGYIAYEKFFVKEENTKTMIDDISIDLNVFYQIGNTLNSFDNAFNKNDNKYFEYLYKEKKLDVKNFDPQAALFVAAKKDMIASNTNQTLLAGKVKNNYLEIFGSNLKYAPASINAGDKYKLEYAEMTKTYMYTLQEKNERTPEYLLHNTKTRIEDGNVIVTRKLFYVEYSGNKAIIYKSAAKDKVGEVTLNNDEVNTNEVVSKYGSKLRTFDYTFVEDKANSFTFYRIEKVN